MKKAAAMFLLTNLVSAVYAYGAEVPTIAKWYKDRRAAISLRFDDAYDSHVKFVIPSLNQHGVKATFMVNPGRDRYIRHEKFWEHEVLREGHHLGNHTMHHHGARSKQEAEYEIGEVSQRIRDLLPQQTRLLVFAAGGATTWDGKLWNDAADDYKRLPERFQMIDLYDGHHHAVHVISTDSPSRLCGMMDTAVRDGKHESFIFHDIGRPGWRDLVKYASRGYHLAYGQKKFLQFIECLKSKGNDAWIAPLAQIYKYETERNSARLNVAEHSPTFLKIAVQVNTDLNLYDQDLTAIVPIPKKSTVVKVFQDRKMIREYSMVEGRLIVDIKPKNSHIQVFLKSVS